MFFCNILPPFKLLELTSRLSTICLFSVGLTPFKAGILVLHPEHIDHEPKLFVILGNFVVWRGVPTSIGWVSGEGDLCSK